MEIDIINKQIGKKIKDLRHQVGLTQQELADRTELTKGYISQLEHGLVAPSVITLLDLIECLGTTPSDFFKETEPEQVVFTDEGFFEKIDEGGNSIQWIVPTAQKNMMEPIRMTLEPGGQTYPDNPHEGEEFGYILSGSCDIHLGSDICRAKKGESFYFRSDRTHYITTKNGCALIWVSTPPSF